MENPENQFLHSTHGNPVRPPWTEITKTTIFIALFDFSRSDSWAGFARLLSSDSAYEEIANDH
jgi:hypothetical protein